MEACGYGRLSPLGKAERGDILEARIPYCAGDGVAQFNRIGAAEDGGLLEAIPIESVAFGHFCWSVGRGKDGICAG